MGIGDFYDACTAQGTGGQYITVLPSRSLVIAHKVNLATATENDYVSLEDYMTMLNMILSAQCQDGRGHGVRKSQSHADRGERKCLPNPEAVLPGVNLRKPPTQMMASAAIGRNSSRDKAFVRRIAEGFSVL
jgi:hypothetical protein